MIIDNLSLVSLVTLFLGVSIFIISMYIAAVSIHEKETRATWISVILAFLLSTPYILIGCSSFSYQQPVALLLIIITIIICLILLLPIKSFSKYIDPTPVNIVDERNTMFSRNNLVDNPKLFNEYYQKNPQYREADDKFRSKPVLKKKGSRYC